MYKNKKIEQYKVRNICNYAAVELVFPALNSSNTR